MCDVVGLNSAERPWEASPYTGQLDSVGHPWHLSWNLVSCTHSPCKRGYTVTLFDSTITGQLDTPWHLPQISCTRGCLVTLVAGQLDPPWHLSFPRIVFAKCSSSVKESRCWFSTQRFEREKQDLWLLLKSSLQTDLFCNNTGKGKKSKTYLIFFLLVESS